MQSLKETARYQVLVEQFHIDSSTVVHRELKPSLERIFFYVFSYTDIWYINFIDERVLYGYIQYHVEKRYKEICFLEAIKDVKNFLYYLKHVKHEKQLPNVDLSTSNYFLWASI